MTNPHHSAELIPFEQVQRLVQERRQRKHVAVDLDPTAILATRTSQVRRLLEQQRSMRPPTGPDAA
jgi:hypothetical protein